MEPETWTALAAVAGAVGTPVVAIWLAKINQQNLSEQRTADDTRAEKQRKHDVQTQQRGRQASLADERAARLRADASEFIAALDEAWRSVDQGIAATMIANTMGMSPPSGVKDSVDEKQREMFRPFMDTWQEGTLEHRVSIATARLSLFGGEVARAAGLAQETLLERHEAIVEAMTLVLLGNLPDERKVWKGDHAHREAEIAAFVAVVREAEQQILDSSDTADGA